VKIDLQLRQDGRNGGCGRLRARSSSSAVVVRRP